MKCCTLCGGRLDENKRCTFCGLDNTKNDDQYKHLLNQSDCDEEPLTHVHENSSTKYKKTSSTYARSTYSKPVVNRNVKSQKVAKKKGLKQIFAIAVVVIGLLSSIFEFTEGFMEEEVIAEYAYEDYLEAGMYTVGVHIPAGTYTIEWDWGELGVVQVCEYIDQVFTVNESYHLSGRDENYEKVVERVVLEQGQVLNVSSELLIYIYSDDVDMQEMNNISNPATTSYVIYDEVTAGVDFQAGVYDILYEPASDEESGNVYYTIWDKETNSKVLEEMQFFVGSVGETYYRNVPLEEGSQIWLDGLEQIKIIPSEVIAPTE